MTKEFNFQELVVCFYNRIDKTWLNDAINLFNQHNEPEVAIECLCDWIIEGDILISQTEYDMILLIFEHYSPENLNSYQSHLFKLISDQE